MVYHRQLASAEAVRRRAQALWKPPPRLTVSQWADRFRRLSAESSAEPGQWRTDRAPYQRGIMDAVSDPRVREIVVMKSAQVGWALSLDTPIPTPTGWATMGDLRVGDEVFDEKGNPCRVVFATPVMHQHECFAVTFSDGERIVADAEHRWFVQSDHAVPVEARPIRRRRTEGVLTTAQLREIGVVYDRDEVKRNRFAVPLAASLDLPDVDLPIAPYTLGAWLGDGHSYTSQITMHESDFGVADRIARDKYCPTVVSRTESGVLTVAIREPEHQRGGPGGRCDFTRKLKSIGVLRNKHIPAVYLRASIAQRFALLQGLMDTDGAITVRGRAEFCSTSQALADGAGELLSSLGIKYTIARSANHAIVQGVKKRSADRFRLSFLPYADRPVFALPRKQDRQRKRGGVARESHTDRRRIVAIDPVRSVPVRCIQVDSERRLYLAGRRMVPTHNTEILGNVVGYHVDRDPSPILLIQPTLDMAEAWSKDRLAPMVRDTPALRGKIKDARSRDSGNTLLHKQFPAGHITMAGANSPASLASRPIRIVLCDEVDRYPASAGTEGDPISLARKRSTTFWNRKLLMGSTPTVKGASRIESAFETSDQRYYEVPCAHCDTMDRLTWPNVKWPEDEPRSAYYACPHCGGVLTDADKARMLPRGTWRATAESDGVAGFHVSELYSPWVTFGQMAAAFVEAKRTPETLRAWINTSLGETWVEKGEAPNWESVLAHRVDYESGEVPDGVIALTSGVDVQKNRLVYVVRGFGKEMFSALVEHGELYGDTDQPEVWARLGNLLATRWGDDMEIQVMCVDSGYRSDRVYEFARRFSQVRATKGHDVQSAPIKASKIDVSIRGRVVKQGLQLWHIDAGHFKSWVHGRIEWPLTEPGAWILPQDVSDEYCKQIVSESRLTLANGRKVWKQMSPDNHYLDAEVLCTAGAYMLQIHRQKPRSMPADATRPVVEAPGFGRGDWNERL